MKLGVEVEPKAFVDGAAGDLLALAAEPNGFEGAAADGAEAGCPNAVGPEEGAPKPVPKLLVAAPAPNGGAFEDALLAGPPNDPGPPVVGVLVEPNENEEDEAGAAGLAGSAALVKEKPLGVDAGTSAGLPKPNGAGEEEPFVVVSAGLLNENPPVAVLGGSAAGAAGVVPKLKPRELDAGAEGVEAEEEPKENPDGLGALSFFSAVAAGVDPKMKPPAAGVEDGAGAGVPVAPKENLGVSAGLSDAGVDELGVPKEKAGLAGSDAAGAGVVPKLNEPAAGLGASLAGTTGLPNSVPAGGVSFLAGSELVPEPNENGEGVRLGVEAGSAGLRPGDGEDRAAVVPSAGFGRPKENPPAGGAPLGVVDPAASDLGRPKSNVGAAVALGAAFSAGLGAPKLKVGVAVPEGGADFLPKKSGTDPFGVVEDSVAGGLPRPRPGEAVLAGGAKKEEASGAFGAGAFGTVREGLGPLMREKKPVSSALGGAAFSGTAVGGESGWAVIEFAARGDDDRGRVDMAAPRSREPFAGGLAAGGPSRLRREPPEGEADCSCTDCGAGLGVEDCSAGGVAAPRLNEMPEKDGRGILFCSSSSMSGRSSSRAEYRPVVPPLGEGSRED